MTSKKQNLFLRTKYQTTLKRPIIHRIFICRICCMKKMVTKKIENITTLIDSKKKQHNSKSMEKGGVTIKNSECTIRR